MGKKELQRDMIRISRGQGVSKITIGSSEADSIIIIPGVTQFNGIFTQGNTLIFSNDNFEETSIVAFNTVADMERTLSRIASEMRPPQPGKPIFLPDSDKKQ
jgi:hypothetical protein